MVSGVKHKDFIREVLENEVSVLNIELSLWKSRTLTPARFLWTSGKPEAMIEIIRKRISRLEICIDIIQ